MREVVDQIDKAMPDDDRVIALDRVLANIDKSQIVPKNVEGVKADPPPIFFSKTAAVIVNLDGEPIWSPIKDNDLKFAVNTNWDLFQHVPTKTYYLRNNDSWLKASDVDGPWTPAGTLPDSFKKLPADDNWKDVKANLPGKAVGASARAQGVREPQAGGADSADRRSRTIVPVTGTELQWVSNTESDVFRMGNDRTGLLPRRGPMVLGAGLHRTVDVCHAVAARGLQEDSARARALARAGVRAGHRPGGRGGAARADPADGARQQEGSQGARRGVPGRSAVPADRDDHGAARGQHRQGHLQGRRPLLHVLSRASGSSARAATGPWEVASSVPRGDLPDPGQLSGASRHLRHRRRETTTTWVTFAAAAGYTGMMVAWGCTVWGTGWYYPPYYGYGGYYPYYYRHFPTYGYSAWYNPWTGAYGRSAARLRSLRRRRRRRALQPAHRHLRARRRSVRSVRRTRRGAGVQPAHGHLCGDAAGVERLRQLGIDRAFSAATTGPRPIAYTNRQTGTTTRTVRTDEGGAVTRRGADGGAVGAGSGGNVYAGKDGNVYRNDGGTWQKYDNGGWNNTDKQPSGQPRTTDRSTVDRSTTDQLNRDSAARREGAQRTQDLNTYRGGTGTRGTGSYRGGGGSRGGGGGRRR